MDKKNDTPDIKSRFFNLLKIEPKLLPAAFFAIFVIALGIYFYVSLSSKRTQNKPLSNGSDNTSSQENKTSGNKKELVTKLAAKVVFKKYTDKSTPVNLPDKLKTYVLKNNFSTQEILTFAQKLGLQTYRMGSDQNVWVYNLEDKEKKGMLSFDKRTGSFSFKSYGVFKPSGYVQSQAPVNEAQIFLKELGLDIAVTCTNAYQKKNLQDSAIFIECHKDWNKTKAPIVNLGGILNVAENKKISDLYIGKIDDFSPIDQSIINIKNIDINGSFISNKNDEGRARPSDFNTITFGISDDGRILSIVSNLRWVEEEKEINQKDLITPYDALALFQNNKVQYSLTIPAGKGVVDFEKVYPQNQAVSNEATIDETSLIFLDKPVNSIQTEYTPAYLIRGTATLSSGYNVKFVQTIPALKTMFSESLKIKEVAGAKTVLAGESDASKLQLGTFKPSDIKPSITPKQVIPGGPQLPSECSDLDGFEVTLNIPDYGTLIVSENAFSSGYHTFFFKSSNNQDQTRETLKNMFFKSVEDQYAINMAKWIKSQNVRPVFSAIDDLYKIFRKINVPFNNPNSQLQSHCLIVISKYEAPVPPDCTSVESSGTIDIDRAHQVAQNVAERIIQLKADNKIDTEASKENLFADTTLRAFYMVFDNTPWDQTGLPENAKIGKCYITGGSPIIYLYPQEKSKVSISVGAPVVYKDPGVIGNVWNITSYPDGTVEQNGVTRSGIYYEYDKSKIKFSEPVAGFIVKTDEWEDFIRNNLSIKLGLNQKETESLITDVQNALFKKSDKEYLKLSLIDQPELNKKLPLLINPKPDSIYRINLFITPIDEKENIVVPQIDFIKRDGFTIVEIGAYTK